MFKIFKSERQLTPQNQHDLALNTTLLASDPHDPDNEAVVTQAIYCHRSGQVKFRGSWWTARSTQTATIAPGEVVYVLGRRNLILFVEATGWAIIPEKTLEPRGFAEDRQFLPMTHQQLGQSSPPRCPKCECN